MEISTRHYTGSHLPVTLFFMQAVHIQLNSIPFSQYLRIKRNCSHETDFIKASYDLHHRLRNRGYSHTLLKRAYNKVKRLDRKKLIFSTKNHKIFQPVRLITQFSKHHNQVRDILNKCWPLLTADRVIKKYIKSYPDITYRRSPSLKDRLITSHHSPIQASPLTTFGTLPCGKCDVCQFIYDSREILLPNGSTHTIKHTVTCHTVGKVYLATCRCGCYYVGKTKRPLCIRIRDHMKPLYKRTTTTAINRHVALQHDFDPQVIGFTTLEPVPLHVRGGGIDQRLLQLETMWIHTLEATRFPGLNEYISYKSFL